MGHYRSNLRDIEFNLFEVFGADRTLGRGPFAEMDADTARGVLAEVERLATGPVADSFAVSDRHPPVFDPEAGTVVLPEAFTRSMRVLLDGGWDRIDLPVELGGYGAPPSVRWAVAELLLGANPAAYLYMSGPGFAAILDRIGTPEQQAFARTMIERQWGATMVLTEPEAGSDVGAGRTRAVPQPDGTWHLEGTKRFITSAEWDLPENIVHFVLARPEGAGPGTKGLSLFLVPRHHWDAERGGLGARNGVRVTGVEKKMGLKVSTTCELAFGADGVPAVGTLVGGVHDGIAQMFRVIEYARMMVGTKAISTLSTGYLNALEYAKQRVQGPDLPRAADKTAPRVPIIAHADVRRMLMLQKAYAEGMRALVLYTASVQDRVELSRHAGALDADAVRLNDLLLPLVKGFGSERSYELLALSLQVLGGSGYTQDHPHEQYLRDAKIDTLYEGTTTIQGLDLLFRKVVRDQGRALTALLTEVGQFAASDDAAAAGNGQLKRERALLATALGDVQAMVGSLVTRLTAAAERPEEVHAVGLNTTRLLLSLGDLVTGWLLLRQAAVALAALGGPLPTREQAFYEGKVAAARFFAAQVLPELTARRAVLEATDLALMELDPAAF